MNKALSYYSYFQGNKKVVIRYILTVLITAVILSMIQIVITNTSNELKQMDGVRNNIINIKSRDKNIIDSEIIKKIEGLDEINSVIPKANIGAPMLTFASTPDSTIYYMKNQDIKKFLAFLNIEYNDDEINSLNKNDILICKRLKNNQNATDTYKLNDKTIFNVKGTINTDYLINFCSADFSQGSNEYLIIPKENCLDIAKDKIRNIIKDQCEFNSNYSEINSLSMEYSDGTFNAVRIIIILTCALTTGVTTYLHYYNRRKEIGILKAIGYSDKKILLRITKEIIVSSLIALIIAFGIISIVITCLNKFISEPNGYLSFAFSISNMSDMIIVILSIMIFSLVPSWMLLKSVDKISLIEGR